MRELILVILGLMFGMLSQVKADTEVASHLWESKSWTNISCSLNVYAPGNSKKIRDLCYAKNENAGNAAGILVRWVDNKGKYRLEIFPVQDAKKLIGHTIQLEVKNLHGAASKINLVYTLQQEDKKLKLRLSEVVGLLPGATTESFVRAVNLE